MYDSHIASAVRQFIIYYGLDKDPKVFFIVNYMTTTTITTTTTVLGNYG